MDRPSVEAFIKKLSKLSTHFPSSSKHDFLRGLLLSSDSPSVDVILSVLPESSTSDVAKEEVRQLLIAVTNLSREIVSCYPKDALISHLILVLLLNHFPSLLADKSFSEVGSDERFEKLYKGLHVLGTELLGDSSLVVREGDMVERIRASYIEKVRDNERECTGLKNELNKQKEVFEERIKEIERNQSTLVNRKKAHYHRKLEATKAQYDNTLETLKQQHTESIDSLRKAANELQQQSSSLNAELDSVLEIRDLDVTANRVAELLSIEDAVQKYWHLRTGSLAALDALKDENRRLKEEVDVLRRTINKPVPISFNKINQQKFFDIHDIATINHLDL